MGTWSGASRITKNFDVEPIAISITTILAKVDQTLIAATNGIGGSALRHKQNFVTWYFQGWFDFLQSRDEVLDFIEVALILNHKLKLKRWALIDPGPNHIRLESESLMLVDPTGIDLPGFGCRIAELWTQGGQIAIDSFRQHGPRSLDGEVVALFF